MDKHNKKVLWALSIILSGTLVGVESQAQVPISPEIPPPEIPPLLPPPEDLLPIPTPPVSQPDEPATTIPGTITVNRFNFEGNTAFSNEQLAEVTAPYTGRPLSFAELLAARSAVTQLYVDNGYLTSGAFIPPQEFQGGVVTIDILEGTLEDINVEVEGRLSPDYVGSRLKIAGGKPLNVPKLLEALQMLQLSPLIENISAELAAGIRSGTSSLQVKVISANTFSAEVILDNGRSPAVGSFRRIVSVGEGNVFGIGDRFDISYRNTDGSDDLELGYNIPLTASNTTLNLGYRYISAEIIESPFDVLDIESEYVKYEGGIRQPLLQNPNQELAIGLSFDYQDTETTLLGEPFAFPFSGANDEGENRVSSLRFYQEWLARTEQQVISARSQFSFGINAFDNVTQAEPPDSLYFSWRGQAQWVRLLAADTVLLARSELQIADTALVPIEKYSLGGLGTVRGYRQDVLLTDNAFFASIEARFPIYRQEEKEVVLQIVPFFDFGTGWNNSGSPELEEDQTLASLGLGLQFQVSDNFTARLDWGIPLIEVDTGDGTWQENGILFTIRISPF
ncbi:MAG: ShlB/FhaC/HecB family hemolysin secretion/activation protein [Gomphosphaeria aponina SAG 52.96 = DSM 107014]|uniref:ShlB/FhaC/HecB family hemolysin secretion/activation protein n=1 Tax=Gomphosphaeria aponina SAG 52.96 = DSM 107014 TaxID=1521640 RepID=A0A941GX12_9CHRO|nr:ShlB/FhaC/HecB family hemolysin secretion/activation protein [Gomphosphaeria aponina SAG 52.96 = DSM 107014]